MDDTNDKTRRDSAPEPGQRPDIVLRDGALRSATWLQEGDYELLSSTAYTRSYKDKDGQFQETSRMRQKDHLPLAELIRETRSEISTRNQEYKRSLGQDRNAEPDLLDRDDRGQDDERSRREGFTKERSQSAPRRRRDNPPDRTAR